MRRCQPSNGSRSHGRYLRQALPLRLSWYSCLCVFFFFLKWACENCTCVRFKDMPHMRGLVRCCDISPETRGKSIISISNRGAVQKHVIVRQTLAPLAARPLHVIALATHPPCITSRLSDRLIHLWVWVVNLTKALSCPGCHCRKRNCQESWNKD